MQDYFMRDVGHDASKLKTNLFFFYWSLLFLQFRV
jgi:hypothetical protein